MTKRKIKKLLLKLKDVQIMNHFAMNHLHRETQEPNQLQLEVLQLLLLKHAQLMNHFATNQSLLEPQKLLMLQSEVQLGLHHFQQLLLKPFLVIFKEVELSHSANKLLI